MAIGPDLAIRPARSLLLLLGGDRHRGEVVGVREVVAVHVQRLRRVTVEGRRVRAGVEVVRTPHLVDVHVAAPVPEALALDQVVPVFVAADQRRLTRHDAAQLVHGPAEEEDVLFAVDLVLRDDEVPVEGTVALEVDRDELDGVHDRKVDRLELVAGLVGVPAEHEGVVVETDLDVVEAEPWQSRQAVVAAGATVPDSPLCPREHRAFGADVNGVGSVLPVDEPGHHRGDSAGVDQEPGVHEQPVLVHVSPLRVLAIVAGFFGGAICQHNCEQVAPSNTESM